MSLAPPRRFARSSNRSLFWRRAEVATTPEARLQRLGAFVSAAGDTDLRDALIRRRRAAAARLNSQSSARTVTLVVANDLAVGHAGAGTPHDNALALDGLTGAPTLPATAVKGICLAASRETGDETDARLFGTGSGDGAGCIGSVTFLAGLARGDVRLGLSVLTPHEPDYYGDPAGNAPAMISAPVPVPFPVVTDGHFEVTILGEPGDVQRVVDLLSTAVDEIGIGAKTSAGYGYLRIVTEPAS